MSALIVPIILAGGQGTRLWPMSRSARPKQFLPLLGQHSLFQESLKRVANTRYANPIVITNNEYRFLVAEQAAEVGCELSGVLLEPVARNTSAAITAASHFAIQKFGRDAVVQIIPSDHSIVVDESYWSAVDTAAVEARSARLVTFGISPTRPETGFGYIEIGKERSVGVHEVARFTEKPGVEEAQRMLASGKYLWNSGMFMFGIETFLSELEKFSPEISTITREAVDRSVVDLDFVRLDKKSFETSPSISIDYAVFEKSSLVSIVPVDFSWSDMGSWDAVWTASEKNSNDNVIVGHADLSSTQRSLVISEKAYVAVHGLDDIVVIASEDAIFVGKLSDAQSVGRIVSGLRASPKTSHLTEIHRTAYRPWGGYSSVLNGDRFQVKRLFVKPGKKLSLQKHFHRAEHWIVVSGTAEVTIDGTISMLTENQSIYLPLGCMHRLANPGKILLELIEVQTGSYLGEDDIVRTEDEFGRV
ncbi:mannose-1-phosphate guanylyltransferase/mannose-6-phosphate isomerase [Mesorhizobium sp.]|uniref:mannose-1-phosphate guanylyltransferase/mannose-6-phosphate isomerase n=1 Tax=Mesorhizobium sp. TaxID=1871066 RepID=UPI000FE60D4A|nr:mannose-1-phosphate guanylyltransferase/mannose-6-phosphate isomerase [Mesorhizobium sp.]RWC62575.1 MAG: mannose-1-phosphate guanylyltransferase/mannose-6-phosphate isomerase [Mesorhizobium sp.]RWC63601.1 MAG: mannose-1-phosphate guanylyltransferase/mannose-6-phosphate isomerase [Mesorhizobium sp.]